MPVPKRRQLGALESCLVLIAASNSVLRLGSCLSACGLAMHMQAAVPVCMLTGSLCLSHCGVPQVQGCASEW